MTKRTKIWAIKAKIFSSSYSTALPEVYERFVSILDVIILSHLQKSSVSGKSVSKYKFLTFILPCRTFNTVAKRLKHILPKNKKLHHRPYLKPFGKLRNKMESSDIENKLAKYSSSPSINPPVYIFTDAIKQAMGSFAEAHQQSMVAMAARNSEALASAVEKITAILTSCDGQYFSGSSYTRFSPSPSAHNVLVAENGTVYPPHGCLSDLSVAATVASRKSG